MSLKPHETSPGVKNRDAWDCVPQNNNEEGGRGHGLYKPTTVSLRMTVWKRFFNYFTSFEWRSILFLESFMPKIIWALSKYPYNAIENEVKPVESLKTGLRMYAGNPLHFCSYFNGILLNNCYRSSTGGF